jgi:hypothetical protein
MYFYLSMFFCRLCIVFLTLLFLLAISAPPPLHSSSLLLLLPTPLGAVSMFETAVTPSVVGIIPASADKAALQTSASAAAAASASARKEKVRLLLIFF